MRNEAEVAGCDVNPVKLDQIRPPIAHVVYSDVLSWHILAGCGQPLGPKSKHFLNICRKPLKYLSKGMLEEYNL